MDQAGFHGWVETSKDASTLAREICILLVFAFLILRPCTVKEVLRKVGLNTLDTPLGDVSLGAGGTVAHLGHGISEVSVALQQIHDKVTDRQVQTDLQNVMDYLEDAQGNTDKGSQDIKKSLSDQAGSQCVSVPTANSGWMLLGLVDTEQQKWLEGPKNVPTATGPKIAEGSQLRLIDFAYVYHDGPQSQPGEKSPKLQSEGSVSGVLEPGTGLTVIEVNYAKATLAKASFVWVKVVRSR